MRLGVGSCALAASINKYPMVLRANTVTTPTPPPQRHITITATSGTTHKCILTLRTELPIARARALYTGPIFRPFTALDFTCARDVYRTCRRRCCRWLRRRGQFLSIRVWTSLNGRAARCRVVKKLSPLGSGILSPIYGFAGARPLSVCVCIIFGVDCKNPPPLCKSLPKGSACAMCVVGPVLWSNIAASRHHSKKHTHIHSK